MSRFIATRAIRGANRIVQEAEDLLERALAELPDKARQIILLRAEGHKYEEISAQVGLTVSGVKMQVKRNLEKLKTALLGVTFLAVATTIIMRAL